MKCQHSAAILTEYLIQAAILLQSGVSAVFVEYSDVTVAACDCSYVAGPKLNQ
jgi:hypothetical protein